MGSGDFAKLQIPSARLLGKSSGPLADQQLLRKYSVYVSNGKSCFAGGKAYLHNPYPPAIIIQSEPKGRTITHSNEKLSAQSTGQPAH